MKKQKIYFILATLACIFLITLPGWIGGDSGSKKQSGATENETQADTAIQSADSSSESETDSEMNQVSETETEFEGNPQFGQYDLIQIVLSEVVNAQKSQHVSVCDMAIFEEKIFILVRLYDYEGLDEKILITCDYDCNNIQTTKLEDAKKDTEDWGLMFLTIGNNGNIYAINANIAWGVDYKGMRLAEWNAKGELLSETALEVPNLNGYQDMIMKNLFITQDGEAVMLWQFWGDIHYEAAMFAYAKKDGTLGDIVNIGPVGFPEIADSDGIVPLFEEGRYSLYDINTKNIKKEIVFQEGFSEYSPISDIDESNIILGTKAPLYFYEGDTGEIRMLKELNNSNYSFLQTIFLNEEDFVILYYDAKEGNKICVFKERT